MVNETKLDDLPQQMMVDGKTIELEANFHSHDDNDNGDDGDGDGP